MAAHTITVSYDTSTGYNYVDEGSANGKHKHAKKNDTITWAIGTGIKQLELYFINQDSPFGSNVLTCLPATPYVLVGGVGTYEYITIIENSAGNLVAPDDPQIILDGGLLTTGSYELGKAASGAGANLVFNIKVG